MSTRQCTGGGIRNCGVQRGGNIISETNTRDCELFTRRTSTWHAELLAGIELAGSLYIACQDPARAVEILGICFEEIEDNNTLHPLFVKAAGWAGHTLDRADSGETRDQYIIRTEATYHAGLITYHKTTDQKGCRWRA